MDDVTEEVFAEEKDEGIGKLLVPPVIIIIELEGERIAGIGSPPLLNPSFLREKGDPRLELLPKRSMDEDKSDCIVGIGRDVADIDE